MNTLTVELMAIGTWKNIKFEANDLKGIASDFSSLRDVLFAPVKMGHNNEQEITDGMPALGEIAEVWYSKTGKDGKPKLMGRLEGLPDVVYKAIKNKRYNKLSIEVDRDVTYKGRFMKFVLTAVALLGADIPAVNTLSDLNAYMSRKSLFTDSKNKVCFTQDFSFNTIQEDYDMNELETAQARIRELEANENTLKDEARDNKSKIETFERDDKSRQKADEAGKVKLARKTINDTFEKAVKDKVITPGQRDQFTKLLNVDDDKAVLNISTDDIDSLLKESGGKMFTKASSKTDNKDERNEVDAGSELTAKAYEIMNTNPNLDFSAAFTRAMRADPDLAKEHMENKKHVA